MTPAPVLVAVAQFAPVSDSVENLGTIAAMTERAAARGAHLVVFPEYSSFFVTPFDDSLARNAQPLDGAFVTGLIALAARHRVQIVAGVVESADAGRVRNTVVAVSGQGVVAVYRKQHLYDAFGERESEWIEAGQIDAPQIFEVEGLRVGLITCYDLRFPEAMRVVVDAGAQLVIVPAEWVRGPLKEDHWMTLQRARAIENTVYVATADHVAPVGVGRSSIIDPSGVVLASLGAHDGIAFAEVNPAEIARVRQINPALALRRYQVVPRP